MPKQYHYSLVFIGLLYAGKLPAQTLADSSFYKSAQDHVIQLYTDSVKENLRLYNGTEFTAAYKSSAGHPFFGYAEPQKGDILYEGIRYPGVRLSYDLTRDELIFVTPANNLNIKLISFKVTWFKLLDHLFVYLTEDSNSVNFPGTGFYELALDGVNSVLAKRKKQLYETSREDNVSKFVELTTWYVRKGETYHIVDSKRSLLRICKDKKAELSKYIQKEDIDFKKDPRAALIKAIDYYTQLKN